MCNVLVVTERMHAHLVVHTLHHASLVAIQYVQILANTSFGPRIHSYVAQLLIVGCSPRVVSVKVYSA